MSTIIWQPDADGDWGTTADWSPAQQPDASDDVTIDTTHHHTVSFTSGDTVTIHSLTVGNDDFTMARGQLTLSAASTFANALTVNSGTLGIEGATSVAGLFTQTDGTISGAGRLTLAGGANFSPSNFSIVMKGSGTTVLQSTSTLGSSGTLYLDGGRTLENQGTFTVTNYTNIYLGDTPSGGTGSATLQNDAGASFIFNSGPNGSNVVNGYGTVAFNNAGSVVNTGSGAIIKIAFNNTGTVSVAAGVLEIDGGGSSAASAFTIASGATLAFASDFILNAGTTNGSGTITASALKVNGPTTITGLLRQSGWFSRVTVTGTLTFAGGASFGFTNGGQGIFAGSGTTVLQGTSTVMASDGFGGSLSLDDGATVENQGTLTATDTSIVLGYNLSGVGPGGGTLQNDASGTLVFNTSSNTVTGVKSNKGVVAFNNAGAVQKNGTGETDITVPFTNTGTVSVTAGKLLVQGTMTGDGTVTVGSGANFTLDASSTTTANTVTITKASVGTTSLTGGSGFDTFITNGGSNTINGGAGLDTAAFSGNRSAYTITHNADGSTTVAGTDGSDTLTHVELAKFADQTVAIGTVAANDFAGTGNSAILWQNDSGQAAIWTMNGFTQTGGSPVGGNPGPAWHVVASGDFFGDGTADILWQNDDGATVAWTMNGLTQTGSSYVGG
ncbi:MAG: hypothetical protein P4L57_14805, partial [Rhizomicrobium sp.]|nr:hypothetical protein [Rhizomicrobium sp.]